ncbi:hypothetical protein KV097_04345 [Mumia sp. zg.B17]|uniref:hypothetical protein n=1 Tax=unclassified Mumia TaxID=2621872 RepID=UPI001C6E39CC|nr:MULTISPECIES: hypothetical protein [unclassified Mumia]MBW9205163.1 hypothetical protein [Mumia sp. zg.B17]MBW9208834.1 hypothetical protein [Mumia sp. zg.B21]
MVSDLQNRRGRVSGVHLRWIMTAAAAVLLLSACSSEDDSATADPTPTPSETATSSTPSPTPTAAATTAPPNPFPGIEMTFTGGRAGDARVEVLKTFVAGSAYSQREHVVPAQLRAVLSRDLSRFFAGAVNDAKKNGWTVPSKPVAHVGRLKGDAKASTVRLCRWSPSISWVDAKTRRFIDRRKNEWEALAISMRSTGDRWVLTAVEPSGPCKLGAPR